MECAIPRPEEVALVRHRPTDTGCRSLFAPVSDSYYGDPTWSAMLFSYARGSRLPLGVANLGAQTALAVMLTVVSIVSCAGDSESGVSNETMPVSTMTSVAVPTLERRPTPTEVPTSQPASTSLPSPPVPLTQPTPALPSATATVPVPMDAPADPSPLSGLEKGSRIEREHPELAASISSLIWVQDGIDVGESQAIDALLDLWP